MLHGENKKTIENVKLEGIEQRNSGEPKVYEDVGKKVTLLWDKI